MGKTKILQLPLNGLAGASTPKISPFLRGVRDAHLTQCVVGPYKCTCQMASKSVERFKQSARI